MSCEKYREMIPLYSGGELSNNEIVALEAHLSECAECAGEAAAYREQRALLSGLGDGEPPPGYADRLWAGVRRGLFVPKGRRIPWPLAYAAMLLMGVSVGFFGLKLLRDRPAPVREEIAAVQPPVIAPAIPVDLHRPLGCVVERLDDATRTQLRLPHNSAWVIKEVDPNGPAGEVGLQSRDIMISVNGKPVVHADELKKHLQPGQVTIRYLHKMQEREVQVRIRVIRKKEDSP